MIRVLVADDQAIVRDGLVTLLSLAEDVAVVGEAADGAEAVRIAAEQQPDVVLMDLRMPVLDGVAATAGVRGAAPGARVVVLTTYADDASIAGALRAGATGYLTKDAGRHELLAAVRSTASGQAVFDASVGARLAAGFPGPAPAGHGDLRDRFPVLTAREAEVLALVSTGAANPQIAAALFVTPATVKSYVTTILAKLQAPSRAQAIALVLGR